MKKVTVTILPEFELLAEIFKVTPQEIFVQFMDDLTSHPGNGGSDERRMSKEYFLRGAIASEIDYEAGEAVLDRFESIYQLTPAYVGKVEEAKAKRKQYVAEMRKAYSKTKP